MKITKPILCCLSFFLVFCFSSDMAFAKKEPIQLGVVTSLGYPHGKEGLVAVQMAVEEINSNGGVEVNGVRRKFAIASSDDRSAAPGVPVSDAIMALNKMIEQNDPVAILVGPYRSEAFLAGMDVLAENKVIELNSIAMSPKMEHKVKTEYDKYKYTFRVSHNAVQMANSIADQFSYLQQKYDFNNLYIIKEDVSWAHAVSGVLKKKVKAMGYSIVGESATALGATDYSMPLTKVRRSNAQSIAAIFSLPETATMVKQMHNMRTPALLAGYHSYIVPGHMWETMNGKVEYAVVTAGELGLVPSEKYPRSVTFFNKFKQRLGHYPDADHSGASAYDSVYMLKNAIERADSLNPDQLVKELEKADYMGVNGRMQFNDNHQVIYGDNPEKAACEVTFQWQDGERVPVLPKSISEGQIILPPWMKK